MLKRIVRKIFNTKSPDEANLEFLLKHGMKLGKNSYINSGCNIDTGWPWLISIGDNVIISSNVTILAHDASTNVVGCGTKLGKVTIGNNVFIGVKSIVLCDVEIGDNAIVGAGSLVTHDLEGNYVYAGVPAKKICSIEEYKKKYSEKRTDENDFSKLHKWNEWLNASEEEKKLMLERMEDTIGFV